MIFALQIASPNLWESVCKAERCCRLLLFFAQLVFLKVALKGKPLLLLVLLWAIAVVIIKLGVVVIS